MNREGAKDAKNRIDLDSVQGIRELIKSYKEDPRYSKEEFPVRKFKENALNDLGFEITRFERNPNDPPDFFIWIKDEAIYLEITTFADNVIRRKDSFFKEIEEFAQSIIKKNFNLLPKGFTLIHFFPGTSLKNERTGFKSEVADFRHRISLGEAKKQLEVEIPKLLSNFDDEKNSTCSLKDIKGNIVGQLKFDNYRGEGTSYSLMPQTMRRKAAWTKDELEKELQKCIDRKADKYNKRTDRNKTPLWWLLISDLENKMQTTVADFDLGTLRFKRSFFERVFLIQNYHGNYKILELTEAMPK